MTSSFSIYYLDHEDCVTGIDGDWNDIAASPEGQSIWHYVKGASLQEVYRQVYHCARTEHPVSFLYRCDSPSHRQTFRMEVISPDGAQIVVRNQLLSAIQRDEPLSFPQAPTGNLVKRCSVCNRYKRRGLWLDIINALMADSFFAEDQSVQLVHTVCQACTQRMCDAARTSTESPPA